MLKEQKKELKNHATKKSLAKLKLDDRNSIGYVECNKLVSDIVNL